MYSDISTGVRPNAHVKRLMRVAVTAVTLARTQVPSVVANEGLLFACEMAYKHILRCMF